jgi:hypothetical protein
MIHNKLIGTSTLTQKIKKKKRKLQVKNIHTIHVTNYYMSYTIT